MRGDRLLAPSGGRLGARLVTLSAAMRRPIADWPTGFDNSLPRELRAEETSAPHESRQVVGAHFTRVRPSVTSPNPALVLHSDEVAASLGLGADDCASPDFLAWFSGSPPATAETWATAYGASFAGRYGGQRGDGRAITVGQLHSQEVQLKGAGTTPFSRQFDGRAVLRSCVREFLASEHMAALGVPTTRALAVVTTGEDVVRRWYDDDGRERIRAEPGAVGTRVATSFLRFGQMELFFQRDEPELLRELADHALRREFGHLLVQNPGAPRAKLYVAMFEEVCERQAHLVAEWLRVGYGQGNLNSDNFLLSGRTMDYGPFGWMERFDPGWCPWVGGGAPYAFGAQPQAAAVNCAGLSDAFAQLVRDAAADDGLPKAEREAAVQAVRDAVSGKFVDSFHAKNDDNSRRKLGLATWDDEAKALYQGLYTLMARHAGAGGVDFTLTFRALCDATPPADDADGARAGWPEGGAAGAAGRVAALLGRAALEPVESWADADVELWSDWLRRYWARVGAEGRPAAERQAEMRAANPKYILRNWMAAEAYEGAARGDPSVARELHAVLAKPYDEQGAAEEERWAQPTPRWARDRPGLHVMS